MKAASEQKRMPSERASVPSSATARYPPRLCDRRIDILRSLTVSPVQIDTEYDYPESNEGVTFGRPDYQPSPCCSHSLTSRRCSFSPYIILSVFIPPLQFWQRTAGQFHPSVRPSANRPQAAAYHYFFAFPSKCGEMRSAAAAERARPPAPLPFSSLLSRMVCTTSTMRVPSQLRSRLGPLQFRCRRHSSRPRLPLPQRTDVGH